MKIELDSRDKLSNACDVLADMLHFSEVLEPEDVKTQLRDVNMLFMAYYKEASTDE